MATDGKIIHVFLASPGDVGEERTFAREYLESELPKSPLLPSGVMFDVVSWDHPGATVPMPAHLTPQEPVIRFRKAPAAGSSNWKPRPTATRAAGRTGRRAAGDLPHRTPRGAA
jgi:hypothetical protein